MSLFQRVVSSCLILIASAATGCATLAAFAVAFGDDGQISRLLDVLTHLAPVYAVVCVAAALLAFCIRSPRRRLVLTLAFLSLFPTAQLMAPEWARFAGQSAPSGAPDTIKVIQINALRSNTDIGRTADWLIAQKPDVVAISEARHDLRDLLLKRAGWKTAGSHGSLIIFTPKRFIRMNRPKLPAGSQLTYVNGAYASASGEMEVVTTHLDWPTRSAFERQAEDLAFVVRRLPRDRMLLIGDFNSTPWSRQLQGLDRKLGLIRRDRAVATWPAQVLGRPWPLPFLPIDHVYAGPGWATVKVERGPWLGSDHYPLIVTLAPISD